MNWALLAWSIIWVIILRAGDTISLYSVSGEDSDTGRHSWGFFHRVILQHIPFQLNLYTVFLAKGRDPWSKESFGNTEVFLLQQFLPFHCFVQCASQVKLHYKDGSYMPTPSSYTANRNKPWSWAVRASWLELRARNSRGKAPGLALPTKHGPKPTLEPRLAHIPSTLAGSQAELQSTAKVTTQNPADPKISKVLCTSQNPPECYGCNRTPALSGTVQNLFPRHRKVQCTQKAFSKLEWHGRLYSTGDSLPFLLKPSFGIEIDHSPLIKREKNTLLSWVRSIHTVTGNHCIYHIPVEAVLALRQPQSPFHAHSADVPITQQRHKPTLKWRAFQYLFKVFFPKIQRCHPTGELGLKRQARQVDKWWL